MNRSLLVFALTCLGLCPFVLHGSASMPEPALRPETVAGWLDFIRNKEDAAILKTWIAATRFSDPDKLDVFGVIANGPLQLDLPPTVQATVAEERPDPFPQAVAALRISLVVPDERWCVVQGNEVYVGDVLVCNFADEVVRIQIDAIERDAIRVSGPSGQRASVPFGPPALALTPATASQDASLSAIPGVSKPRTPGSPSASIPIRLGTAPAHNMPSRPSSPRNPRSEPSPPFGFPNPPSSPNPSPVPPFPQPPPSVPLPSESLPLDIADPGFLTSP